jgi:hypothetical protein
MGELQSKPRQAKCWLNQVERPGVLAQGQVAAHFPFAGREANEPLAVPAQEVVFGNQALAFDREVDFPGHGAARCGAPEAPGNDVWAIKIRQYFLPDFYCQKMLAN